MEIIVDPEANAIHQRTRGGPFLFYSLVVEVKHGGVRRRAQYASPRRYDPAQPLSPDEVEHKFLGLAGPVLGAYDAGELARLVLRSAEDEPAAGLAGRLGSRKYGR